MSEINAPLLNGAGDPSTRVLHVRLRELRRLIRWALVVRAVSILVMATIVLCIFSFAVDRTFRLSLAGRVVAQTVLALSLIWVGWRYLLHPLITRLTDPVLADLLEKRFPSLYDRFRSALEFLRDPALLSNDSGDASRADIGLLLKREVVREALEDAKALDVKEVIHTPNVASALMAAVASLAVTTVLAVVLGGTVDLWFQRNVLFRDVEWPYRTRLFVENFPDDPRGAGIPRGDGLTIRVRAEGEVPDRVRIRVSYENETLQSNIAREGGATFVHEQAEVTEPFTFTVEGGDFRSRPHTVYVKERPEVETILVRLEYPPHTVEGKAPVETLEGDIGELPVPEGTTVHVEGTASKELRRAWLDAEGRDIALDVSSAEPRRFSGTYLPDKGSTVTVHLEDREGVPPNQWFRFVVTPVPDRLPRVLVRTEGVGSMITPAARIPLHLRATDDYKVVATGIEHKIREIVDGGQDSVDGRESCPPLVAPGPRVTQETAWEVGPLAIVPEKRLEVRVFAVDNDGLNGPKTGYAATQSFLVVTPERLGEEFLRREEEQRRQLERVIEAERIVRDSTYRLIDASWKLEGALSTDVRKEMVALARTERQLSRQVGSIAGAMRLLRDEMQNNRVGELEEAERLMNSIIDPLVEIAEERLPDASTRFGRIRELGAPVERLEQGLALAQELESIIQSMEAVLTHMKRLEGFTEIVNRMRDIIKIQGQSEQEAVKTYRREVDSILEEVPEEEGPGPVPPGGE